MKTFDRSWFLEGNWHHVLGCVGLALLSLHQPWVLSITLVYLYKLYRYDGILFLVGLGLASTVLIHHELITPVDLKGRKVEAQVLYTESAKNRVIAQSDEGKVLIYLDDDYAVHAGDYVVATGNYRESTVPSMPGEFDYDTFLLSVGIDGVFYADTVTVMREGFSVYQFREWVDDYITERYDAVGPYIRMFVLADRNAMDDDVLEATQSLGIAHLFAISGLHISLLTMILITTLKQFKCREGFIDVALGFFLSAYLILTVFAVSVVRASLMMVGLRLSKKLHFHFTGIDMLSMLAVFLLLINPLFYVQTGFMLSFLVAFSLMCSSPILSKKSTVMSGFYVSAIAFFATLPLISDLSHGVHPLTILLNVMFVFYTMFLLLPFGYITFALPFFEALYGVIIVLFEWLVIWTHRLFSLRVNLYFGSMFFIIIYYGLWLWILQGKKMRVRVKYMAIYLMFLLCLPYVRMHSQVVVFHVHGDSLLVRDAFNRCTMLIDTGESTTHHQLSQSLYALRVTRLDYVFISHWHYDHYGAYDEVSNHFPVLNLITRENAMVHESKWIECGHLAFYIFPMEKEYACENNHSIMMLIKIADDIILFTGDIEREREQAFNEDLSMVTMLKVAHHGSRTSSNTVFLEQIQARDALVSAHRRNRFDHPHQETLDRLKHQNMTIHRTDQEGTIFFNYYFGNRIKKTPYQP